MNGGVIIAVACLVAVAFCVGFLLVGINKSVKNLQEPKKA